MFDLGGINAGVEGGAVEDMGIAGYRIEALLLPSQGDRLNTTQDLNGDEYTSMRPVVTIKGEALHRSFRDGDPMRRSSAEHIGSMPNGPEDQGPLRKCGSWCVSEWSSEVQIRLPVAPYR